MNALSRGARERIEAALGRAFGSASPITAFVPVGGGSISRVARIDTAAGESAFLKWSAGDRSRAPEGIFAAEAAGLELLRDAAELRVPAVFDCVDSVSDDRGPSTSPERWLLFEWLPPASPGRNGWIELGARLARLHRSTRGEFGWERDNFIGSLPQRNRRMGSWPEFWRVCRLEPQLALAYDSHLVRDGARRRFDALLASLDDLLAAAAEDGPSLLHGDLWSGNVHFTGAGQPALIDPSVYYGHREVDLAMAELFGGFPETFRRAYAEEWPLLPGFAERRPIYQLYYLLVHVNLFGAGYLASTLSALAEAGFP